MSWRSRLLGLICLYPLMLYAKVYMVEQPDGSILYTDKPATGAVEVKVDKPSSVKWNKEPPTSSFYSGSKKSSKKNFSYGQFSITTPVSESTIRNNEGLVRVGLSISPELRHGDKLVVYLNGKAQKALYSDTAFELKGLDRGKHELVVGVRRGKDKLVFQKTEAVIFYLHRNRINQVPPALRGKTLPVNKK